MASLNGSFLNLTRLCSINAEVLNQKLLFLSMIRYGACQNGQSLKTIESLRRKNLPSVSEGLKKASIVCGQWPFMNYLDSRLR